MSLKRRDKKLPIPFSCRFLVVRISFSSSSSSSFLSLIDSDDLCASLSLSLRFRQLKLPPESAHLGESEIHSNTISSHPSRRSICRLFCFFFFFFFSTWRHDPLDVDDSGCRSRSQHDSDDSGGRLPESRFHWISSRFNNRRVIFLCVWRGNIISLISFPMCGSSFSFVTCNRLSETGLLYASLSIVSRLVKRLHFGPGCDGNRRFLSRFSFLYFPSTTISQLAFVPQTIFFYTSSNARLS